MPYATIPFEFLSYAFQSGIVLLTRTHLFIIHYKLTIKKKEMLIFFKMLVNFQIPLKGNERSIYGEAVYTRSPQLCFSTS